MQPCGISCADTAALAFRVEGLGISLRMWLILRFVATTCARGKSIVMFNSGLKPILVLNQKRTPEPYALSRRFCSRTNPQHRGGWLGVLPSLAANRFRGSARSEL